ncbi:hypothetical protein [Cellulomonas sp. URHB0016]
MTRDLTDLMHADVSSRERSMAGLQPTAEALAGTVRRVRRTRAVRHTLRAGGIGAVAVVLVGASWYGLRGHTTPVPAHTPTPTVSTPVPTGTPTPSARPVVLDDIRGLPPTQAMPPGLLEQTTAGWVLTVYRSTAPQPGEFQELPGSETNTVVLVSPDGDRYRVVDLPTSMSLSLLRWHAGSTTAVLYVGWDGDYGSGAEARAVLDLTTGEVTPTDLGLGHFNGGPLFHGVTADGAELWSTGTSTDSYTSDVYRRTDDGTLELVGGMGSWAVLDPTGQRLATDFDGLSTLAVIDVVNGGRTDLDVVAPEQRCQVVSWIRTDALLAVCADLDLGGGGPSDRPRDVSLSRIDIADGSANLTELRRFADDEPYPDVWGHGAAPLVDGRVALVMKEPAGDGCDAGVSIWDGRALTPLQDGGSVNVVAVGGSVYVESAPSCGGLTPTTLTVHDLASGASTVLAPPPAPTGDVPAWSTGLWSWVPAE